MSPAVARIRRAVRAVISLNGGIDGAAATCGKSRALAGNWNNANLADTPTLADAFALDEIAVMQGKCPPITSALAAELGCVVICLPDVSGCASALGEALVAAMAEFGDIAASLRDAQSDGRVIPKERTALLAEIDQAQAALARMRALAAAGE